MNHIIWIKRQVNRNVTLVRERSSSPVSSRTETHPHNACWRNTARNFNAGHWCKPWRLDSNNQEVDTEIEHFRKGTTICFKTVTTLSVISTP